MENGNANIDDDGLAERSERISTSSVQSSSLLSSSPPLPSSQPPPPSLAPRHSSTSTSSSTLPAQGGGGASRGYNNGRDMREGYGVQGTKELLSKKAGSREGKLFFIISCFFFDGFFFKVIALPTIAIVVALSRS